MKIDDNNETVTCRLCGQQCKRIYGRHLKNSHDGMTTKEYKERFPGAPIMALKDRQATTKNGGQHMKLEKYKKMFSEMFSGEKNPMHRSKTTKKFRQQQSPFSVEFYKLRYPDMSDDEIENEIKKLANSFTEDRLLPSNVEYWIQRGYTEEEALALVTENQTTFSKEICIEKHGEEEGLKIWENRQEKWIATMDSKSDDEKREINRKKLFNDTGYSKISVELFNSIYDEIKDIELRDKTYFATKGNGEYIRYNENTGSHYRIDFVNSKLKKAIEFNGDFWHCNPNYYDKDYYHKLWKKPAREIWEQDRIKEKYIKEEIGYDLLIIWESDYRRDKEGTVQRCIDFLES